MAGPGILDSLRSLSQIPQEARSAGAGLAAKQQNVNQAAASPAAVPTNPPDQSRLYSQDMAHAQGPYGSRLGEQRLDSEGNAISGLSGVKRAPQKHSYSGQ